MTDLNTEVAVADASAPLALERSAPASTPAHLSTHDAAAVLRKLRQPKNDQPADSRIKSGDATSAAPAETTDSSADLTDDAAPATQDPGEKTETADPAHPRESGEAPPIEPPRSWTKEDKELFASLRSGCKKDMPSHRIAPFTARTLNAWHGCRRPAGGRPC
jgi:hypothetical protein